MATEVPAAWVMPGLCAGAEGSFVGFRATHGIRDSSFPNRFIESRHVPVPLRCGKALEV